MSMGEALTTRKGLLRAVQNTAFVSTRRKFLRRNQHLLQETSRKRDTIEITEDKCLPVQRKCNMQQDQDTVKVIAREGA